MARLKEGENCVLRKGEGKEMITNNEGGKGGDLALVAETP